MSDTIRLTARNAGLPEIKTILEDQRARRLDLITTGEAFRATADGTLLVSSSSVLEADGVTDPAGEYVPTETCDRTLGDRLDIPERWLCKLREQDRGDIWAAAVNGRLHGNPYLAAVPAELAPTGQSPDGRKHMLRLFRGDEGQPGVARAFLSPKYKIIDSLDVLVAVLRGVRKTGTDVHPAVCDLSDRRFYMTLEAPGISALAPHLLAGYRSPFDGPSARQRAGHNGSGQHLAHTQGEWEARRAQALATYGEREVGNVVWAGLVVSNSDTGGGARFIAPQIRVLTCRNGMTLTAQADRKVHLGAEQEQGIINWSAETVEAELALITEQVTDAVTTFLSPEYLAEQVAVIEAQAGVPVTAPEATIKAVAKTHGFSQAEADEILGMFIAGGQMTAGGVANAITAYAQVVPSADRAYELGLKALPAMASAAKG